MSGTFSFTVELVFAVSDLNSDPLPYTFQLNGSGFTSSTPVSIYDPNQQANLENNYAYWMPPTNITASPDGTTLQFTSTVQSSPVKPPPPSSPMGTEANTLGSGITITVTQGDVPYQQVIPANYFYAND